MAGINRLGKAPPGPRIVRPVDPTRNRVTDFLSENREALESDRDYQRAVQDIEDAAQTQGWLFGRGAFDKTDLLYLRDQEEKTRHTEMELHDREVQAYAQQRMLVEKQKPAGAIGPAPSNGLGVTKKIGKPRQPPKALQHIIKVSRGAAAVASKPAHTAAAPVQQPVPQLEPAISAGLGDLLGAYGSGSDSDEEAGNAQSPAAKPAEAPSPAATAAAVAAGSAKRQSRIRSPPLEQVEVDYGDGA